MVRSPAAPSPFRFSGLLFTDSDSGGPKLTSASPGRGGGDHDGACRAQRGTGSSTTDRKICSTNRGRRLPSRAQRCGRRTERSSERSSEFGGVDRVRCPLARANNRKTRRLLTNRPGSSFSTKSPIPTNGYASAIGLCKDSMMMQSRKPSNSDF